MSPGIQYVPESLVYLTRIANVLHAPSSASTPSFSIPVNLTQSADFPQIAFSLTDRTLFLTLLVNLDFKQCWFTAMFSVCASILTFALLGVKLLLAEAVLLYSSVVHCSCVAVLGNWMETTKIVSGNQCNVELDAGRKCLNINLIWVEIKYNFIMVFYSHWLCCQLTFTPDPAQSCGEISWSLKNSASNSDR